MYTDYYLKFVNEAEAKAVLYHMEGVVEANEELGIEANEGYEVANYVNIDTLGILYEKQEIIDLETQLPGWHVNIRALPGEDVASLEPYRVNPEPQIWRRVWF